MPINSFDNYPMTWKLSRQRLISPLYLSISAALEEDIKAGILAPNTKLPPQRELADYLDINLSTVTKAFKICEMKGLIYATVGKGTYISPNAIFSDTLPSAKPDDNHINLSLIKPFYQFNETIGDIAQSIISSSNVDLFFEYTSTQNTCHYNLVGQKWLQQFHLAVSSENIITTLGIQNALLITLLSLFNAGDKIAVDLFTYPNFIGLANLLNIQLVPIENDECGMIPESLEMNCKINGIKGIYLVPSCNNPTAIAMPQSRRIEIASIIKNQNLILIEDDPYATLTPDLYPISYFVPDQFIYASGTSKVLNAGLRIAFITFSDKFRSKLLRGKQNINLKIPQLNLEIISKLIERGIATQLISERVEQSKKRNAIFKKYFSVSKHANQLSFFQWLPLPKGYSGHHFELQAKKSGVLLFGSDRFTIGSSQENPAVRISLCSVANSIELETALKILKHLINETYQ